MCQRPRVDAAYIRVTRFVVRRMVSGRCIFAVLELGLASWMSGCSERVHPPAAGGRGRFDFGPFGGPLGNSRNVVYGRSKLNKTVVSRSGTIILVYFVVWHCSKRNLSTEPRLGAPSPVVRLPTAIYAQNEQQPRELAADGRSGRLAAELRRVVIATVRLASGGPGNRFGPRRAAPERAAAGAGPNRSGSDRCVACRSTFQTVEGQKLPLHACLLRFLSRM